MSGRDLSGLPHLPSRDLLGGRVTGISQDGAGASVRFAPPETMLNPNGVIQGGYIAAMLDDAAGVVTWFGCGEQAFTTAQMSVNYMRAAPPQTAFVAEARVSYTGKRQAVIHVVLAVEGSGRPLAEATIVQMFTGGAGPASGSTG